MIYTYCGMIATIGSAILIISHRYDKRKEGRKKFLPCDVNFLGFTVNNFSVFHTAVLAESSCCTLCPCYFVTTLRMLAEVGFGFNQFSCMNGFTRVHH